MRRTEVVVCIVRLASLGGSRGREDDAAARGDGGRGGGEVVEGVGDGREVDGLALGAREAAAGAVAGRAAWKCYHRDAFRGVEAVHWDGVGLCAVAADLLC